MRIIQSTFLGFVFLLSASTKFQAAPVEVYGPSEAGVSLDGNAFSELLDPTSPGRFQQVFSSTVFEVLGISGGGWITEIDFRIDLQGGHPFNALLPHAQFNLSTTSRAVDGLGSVFDENVGADDVIVREIRNISVSGLGGGRDRIRC